MQFKAKARNIRFSPLKMRPIADVVRGKNVQYALHWLATHPVKRARSIRKLIQSAAANAKSLQNIEPVNLFIKEIKVDQGPIYKYYKPGAMGRSEIQRKRFSHTSVVLGSIEKKEA